MARMQPHAITITSLDPHQTLYPVAPTLASVPRCDKTRLIGDAGNRTLRSSGKVW